MSPRKETDDAEKGKSKPRCKSRGVARGKDTTALVAQKESKSAPVESADFPIVGIGASAGGLEAFEQFFNHMPPDSGMAFVIVQHLDPTHKSTLTDLLKSCTRPQIMERTSTGPGAKAPMNTDIHDPKGIRLALGHAFNLAGPCIPGRL